MSDKLEPPKRYNRERQVIEEPEKKSKNYVKTRNITKYRFLRL